VVRKAVANGWTVTGLRDGWAGALNRDTLPLTIENTDGTLAIGGTLLGSSRTNPLRKEEEYARVKAIFDELNLDGLVAIGGDDTLSVAGKLADDEQPVVGIPKTIDNDVPGTEACIGFDSAVSAIAESIGRLRTTTMSHHRITVVEAMGRQTGWLAAVGGIAGGADYIAVPEQSTHVDQLIRHVQARRERGLDHSIIVVAEGAEIAGLEVQEAAIEATDQFGHVLLSSRGLGDTLAHALEEATGIETRASVLGHLQRGGTPTPFDRVLGTRCGVTAVQWIDQGVLGVMTGLRDGRIEPVPLTQIAGRSRALEPSYLELLTLFA
jgi:6-phosphofructokinase 1